MKHLVLAHQVQTRQEGTGFSTVFIEGGHHLKALVFCMLIKINFQMLILLIPVAGGRAVSIPGQGFLVKYSHAMPHLMYTYQEYSGLP